jgi:hypothetical protein
MSMSMGIAELEAESSAQLLPGREALGRCTFRFFKNVHITRHVADVHASNASTALNIGSAGADAESLAGQGITITQ